MSASIPDLVEDADLYDRDFLDWTRRQADLLRHAGGLRLNAVPGLDWEHLAEEIEDMGKALPRELHSRYKVLLVHLLKWRYQPDRRGTSWRLTIRDQRDEIEGLLAQSPSLRGRRTEELARAYGKARRYAADETELPLATFPVSCPFALDEVEDEDFLPEAID